MKYVILMLLLSFNVLADGFAIPNMGGGCPSQYRSSGGYCIPTSNRFAIPRDGGCPSGFYSSGTYCVANNSRYSAVPSYNGKGCPLGYFKSGNYCVNRGR